MSIQWTFVAGYLYFEMLVVAIMILPLVSPRTWNKFFKSGLFAQFQMHAAIYFYILLGVLCLFMVDAVREMRKYSHSTDGASHIHLGSEMKGNVKLFRAQRNFYMTGFAIFLAFVIRRLVTMIIIQDELNTKAADIIKEAENTVNLAKTTILANTLLASEHNYEELKLKLDTAEDLLKEEQCRVKDLEEEVKIWKLKYEEASMGAVFSVGKGDE